MAISDEKGAFEEGQKMGMALVALAGGPNPDIDVQALNYLARKFCKWEGLANVDLAFSYVSGFISGATQGTSQKQIGGASGGE